MELPTNPFRIYFRPDASFTGPKRRYQLDGIDGQAELSLHELCRACADTLGVHDVVLHLPNGSELMDDDMDDRRVCEALSMVTKATPLHAHVVHRKTEGETSETDGDETVQISETDEDEDESDEETAPSDSLHGGERGEPWSKLGYALPEPRGNALDETALDMSMFAPQYHTEGFRKALCLLYAHLTAETPATEPLSMLLVQKKERTDLKVNTLAGYVQVGKTLCGATAAYLLCYACSLVPVIFVRGPGGGDSMDNFRAAIEGVATRATRYLRGKIDSGDITIASHMLGFFRPTLHNAQDLSDITYGRRTCGLVIIARQNPSAIQKLFGETRQTRKTAAAGQQSFADQARRCLALSFGTTMKRYALVCDEDDAAQGSAGRDATRTDHANYRYIMPIRPVMLRIGGGRVGPRPLPNATPVSDSEPDRDSDGDLDPDGAVSFKEIISTDSVRATAACVIQISASWLTNETFESSRYRQKTRVIVLPVPPTYMGIWPDGHDERKVIVETVAEALPIPRAKRAHPRKPKRTKSQSARAYAAGLAKYEERLAEFEEHSTRRAEYLECPAWYRHKAGLSEMFEDCLNRTGSDHVSIHINTPSTASNANQASLATHIIDRYGREKPMVTFAYNQESAKALVLRLSKHVAWVIEPTAEGLEEMLQGRDGPILNRSEEALTDIEEDDDMFFITLTCATLRLQRTYSIIFALFERHQTQPFVVCVTGHLGGRAFTFKTIDHRYPLTDQFFDTTCYHMERLLQYPGRIASIDELMLLVRRLWIPRRCKEALYRTIRVYAEVAALYKRYPDSEFADLLTKINTRDYPNMCAYFNRDVKLHISRPKVHTDSLKRKHSATALEAQTENVVETQENAVVRALQVLRHASASDIKVYLRNSGNLVDIPNRGDLTGQHITRANFITTAGSGSIVNLIIRSLNNAKGHGRVHTCVSQQDLGRKKIWACGRREDCGTCSVT